jgi:Ca2+/Na+ antiporter
MEKIFFILNIQAHGFNHRFPSLAIILFSGLGSIEDAQETLSVGVGALAGSTIMLLTVPWALSVYGGSVDIRNGKPAYTKRPKLSDHGSTSAMLRNTGVAITGEVSHAGIVMAITTLPYFLIQIPAAFMHGPSEEVAEGEHWWALSAFIVCLGGLFYYMKLQLRFSREGQDKHKRIAVTKKILQEGKLSLTGALKNAVEQAEHEVRRQSGASYNSISPEDPSSYPHPQPAIASYLKDILIDAFKLYDVDRSGHLEKKELRLFFKDFHENIAEEDIDTLLSKADTDLDGTLSFDEFIGLAYNLIISHDTLQASASKAKVEAHQEVAEGIWREDDDEEEEIPEEFTSLSPEAQQRAIKLRAFRMLAIGTIIVIYFSDPMVDVMQEIAVRAGLPPFYVSFVLAPLASNASEVVASMYYAGKKTRKTMSVSLSALEGAASMNNTFW